MVSCGRVVPSAPIGLGSPPMNTSEVATQFRRFAAVRLPPRDFVKVVWHQALGESCGFGGGSLPAMRALVGALLLLGGIAC